MVPETCEPTCTRITALIVPVASTTSCISPRSTLAVKCCAWVLRFKPKIRNNPTTTAAPAKTKPKSKWNTFAGAAAVAGLFLIFGLNRGTQAQHFTAKVERGDIHDVVDATGTINSVITVQVGSQVSGSIAKLNADFNSRVHKGDIVALIDPALFQGALLQATADLENAKANLAAARANLEKTKAGGVQAKADYVRTVALSKEGVMSQQQLDLAKANFDSANAAVNGAVANVTQAEAQVTQKAAAVTVAQTNLNYTVIRSPIDGTVVARNVDVGQTVAASLQAPTIFTIAQDLKK